MAEVDGDARASEVGVVGVAVADREPADDRPEAAERARRGLNFSDKRQRDEHVAAFMAQLHSTLRCAPGIDWAALPSRVMGYLMNTTGKTVDTLPVTLAIGCARVAMDARALLYNCQALTALLRRMRAEGVVTALGDLRERATWDAFTQRVGRSPDERRGGRLAVPPGIVDYMARYQAVAGTHVRDYVNDTLTPERRARWQRTIDALGHDPALRWSDFVLPPMPHKYLDRTGIRGRDNARGL